MGNVDWSGKLEAVHEDGRVVPLEPNKSYWPDNTGDYLTLDAGPNVPLVWTSKGYPWLGGGRLEGWRIRNVTEPATCTAADSVGRVPALFDRMAALCRHAATSASGHTQKEARAIVATLPEPVDPDWSEARQIAVLGVIEVDGTRGLKVAIMAGREDGAEVVQTAFAAIKRGRQLAGEGK